MTACLVCCGVVSQGLGWIFQISCRTKRQNSGPNVLFSSSAGPLQGPWGPERTRGSIARSSSPPLLGRNVPERSATSLGPAEKDTVQEKPTLPASVVVVGGLLPRRPWICRFAPAVAKKESWLTDNLFLLYFCHSYPHDTHMLLFRFVSIRLSAATHISSSYLLGERHADI